MHRSRPLELHFRSFQQPAEHEHIFARRRRCQPLRQVWPHSSSCRVRSWRCQTCQDLGQIGRASGPDKPPRMVGLALRRPKTARYGDTAGLCLPPNELNENIRKYILIWITKDVNTFSGERVWVFLSRLDSLSGLKNRPTSCCSFFCYHFIAYYLMIFLFNYIVLKSMLWPDPY